MSGPNDKIVSELSEEELLQIARGAKADKVIEKISEAAKFIYALGIREGRMKISAMLIYHTYKAYKGFDNKRQSKRYFFKDFNRYFTAKRDNQGLYYLLNAKPFDTSKENFWIMRADWREEKAKKRKKIKT